NLATGAGAAWNARARFPAASSVKIAIAIEVLRELQARPPPGSGIGNLLELTVENQPSFEGKYTTAYDLAQLHRFVHLAALGGGPLLDLDGFTAADARFLLYVLAHSADHG